MFDKNWEFVSVAKTKLVKSRDTVPLIVCVLYTVQGLLEEASQVVGGAAGWRVWPAQFIVVLPRQWKTMGCGGVSGIGTPKGGTRYKVKQG